MVVLSHALPVAREALELIRGYPSIDDAVGNTRTAVASSLRSAMVSARIFEARDVFTRTGRASIGVAGSA